MRLTVLGTGYVGLVAGACLADFGNDVVCADQEAGKSARLERGERGFDDGVATRLLVYAAQLVVAGIAPRRACDVAIASGVTDEADVQRAIADIIDVLLP